MSKKKYPEGWEPTPLLNDVASGDLFMVETWVERGADVNAKDEQGDTALMIASRMGYLDIAKYLIEHHADVNAKNKEGETALSLAKRENHSEIVEFLRAHGAEGSRRSRLQSA